MWRFDVVTLSYFFSPEGDLDCFESLLQRSLLTTAPSAPGLPFSPGFPGGPEAPISPGRPAGPVSPRFPLGPSLPDGPGGPGGPEFPYILWIGVNCNSSGKPGLFIIRNTK